ncbi:hypothetical protein L1987_45564 [Smallanthus sonchifolius]|uniref:Uncharacterized protein n=1 Tax=Smallanthus sonchifolius TaxID=185202 RepID=A0ACB9FYB4_9ASTR|nr:hypothetical protein L1987_45564 [Smallanthus sonchifolius]
MDLVNSEVAHNLMRLIAEGFGEDDDTEDSQLRSSAAYAVTALMKVFSFEKAAGRNMDMLPECIESLSASHSTDLQQRAYELQAISNLDAIVIQNIMPLDASCEDIQPQRNKNRQLSSSVRYASPFDMHKEAERSRLYSCLPMLHWCFLILALCGCISNVKQPGAFCESCRKRKPTWCREFEKISNILIVDEGVEILANNNVRGSKDKYTDVDIDGVREEWSTYVSNFIFR